MCQPKNIRVKNLKIFHFFKGTNEEVKSGKINMDINKNRKRKNELSNAFNTNNPVSNPKGCKRSKTGNFDSRDLN